MDIRNLLTRILGEFPKRIKSENSSLADELACVYVNCWDYSASDTADLPNESISFLGELKACYKDLSNGLLGSNMHFVWLLAHLSRENILERPKELMSMAYDAVNRNAAYYNNSPIQVDLRERFYSIGVGMLSLYDHSDTISRYVWEEQIIFKLCDCEKFLTTDISHLYSPTQLTAGILHSVIAFANLAIKYKIYPYKAYQIKEIASTLHFDLTKSNDNDIVILDLMCNRLVSTDISSFSDDSWCRLLSEGGMLSTMYEEDSLFSKLLQLAYEFHPEIIARLLGSDVPEDYLPGIAMGLINIINNDETEHQ